MGDLFFFQDVYDKAMKAYKKSYYYDKEYTKDKEGIAVNFGDIVLADTTKTIREWSSHYQRPNRLLTYPNFSSQYYTGWYRLHIAPGPIN